MFNFDQNKLYKYSEYLKVQQHPQLLIFLKGKMRALLPVADESQGIKPCHI